MAADGAQRSGADQPWIGDLGMRMYDVKFAVGEGLSKPDEYTMDVFAQSPEMAMLFAYNAISAANALWRARTKGRVPSRDLDFSVRSVEEAKT